MMLGLRMMRGVKDQDFMRMHGLSIREAFGEKLDKPIGGGLLQWHEGAFAAYAPGDGSAKQRACGTHVTHKQKPEDPSGHTVRLMMNSQDDHGRVAGRIDIPATRAPRTMPRTGRCVHPEFPQATGIPCAFRKDSKPLRRVLFPAEKRTITEDFVPSALDTLDKDIGCEKAIGSRGRVGCNAQHRDCQEIRNNERRARGGCAFQPRAGCRSQGFAPLWTSQTRLCGKRAEVDRCEGWLGQSLFAMSQRTAERWATPPAIHHISSSLSTNPGSNGSPLRVDGPLIFSTGASGR